MEPSTVSGENRRESPRIGMSLAVQAGIGDSQTSGTISNLSAGGVCLELEGQSPKVGESVRMSVTVPGSNKPVDVEGEVRWTSESSRRGRCGIMFRRGHESLLMSLLTVFIGGATAMTTQAATTVPTFDPNADVVLDMNGGVDMPDSHTVLQAVTGSYDAIDTCVAQSRGKKKRITGDAHVAVLLNPQGRTPLGVNAELPRALAKNVKLKECVRSAVATAPYPSYDGPPVVVELDVELDPGEMEFPE